jgi:hypothetical protein
MKRKGIRTGRTFLWVGVSYLSVDIEACSSCFGDGDGHRNKRE